MVDFTTCVWPILLFLRHVLSFFQLLRLPNLYRAPDALRRCGAYLRAVLTRNSARTARLLRTP